MARLRCFWGPGVAGARVSEKESNVGVGEGVRHSQQNNWTTKYKTKKKAEGAKGSIWGQYSHQKLSQNRMRNAWKLTENVSCVEIAPALLLGLDLVALDILISSVPPYFSSPSCQRRYLQLGFYILLSPSPPVLSFRYIFPLQIVLFCFLLQSFQPFLFEK